MPRAKLSDELKAAIAQMPDKEKDKLLYRLIAKDEELVNRLTFELLEGTGSREERRSELATSIDRDITYAIRSFYSPGFLLLDLRAISGDINRHVKATKDKYGEIELNLLMLNLALEGVSSRLDLFPASKARTFSSYVVKRTLKLQKLLAKMHDDIRLDFDEEMERLGQFIRNSVYLKKMAEHEGLEWRAL
ncbi:MAG: hypothetical protein KI786_08840 [Mameliella sp.]|nr:hypothetical protein [Phaeodactylibacter sp.]